MDAVRTISILGCGWYGLPLAKGLLKNGFSVKGSTTSASKLDLLADKGIEPFLIDTEKQEYENNFFTCDLLIVCIPPKVNSNQLPYPIKIETIASAAQKAGVKQIILISSTGIFQDGNFVVDEKVIPEPNTESGKALLAAENILKANRSFQTTIIRFAGLIGPNRNLAKHFAGKKDIANGLAPINLIHLTDCIGLTIEIIHKKGFGITYHGVSPSHPSRRHFYTQACIACGLEEPKFVNELLNWKQIESKNVADFLTYKYVFMDWNKYFEELKSAVL